MITQIEENYLKAIFKLADKNSKSVNTNSISAEIHTSAASVTDMLKRLAEKKLVRYEKYKGAQLTKKGVGIATQLVRNHRLWELFLVEKLHYNWDEVHDMAEQLEHVRSNTLIERLDTLLGNPSYDPHGDPIPNKDGVIDYQIDTLLADVEAGIEAKMMGVKDHTPQFLQYLDSIGLQLGSKMKVIERVEYDQSIRVLLPNKNEITLSKKVCENLYVTISSN